MCKKVKLAHSVVYTISLELSNCSFIDALVITTRGKQVCIYGHMVLCFGKKFASPRRFTHLSATVSWSLRIKNTSWCNSPKKHYRLNRDGREERGREGGGGGGREFPGFFSAINIPLQICFKRCISAINHQKKKMLGDERLEWNLLLTFSAATI